MIQDHDEHGLPRSAGARLDEDLRGLGGGRRDEKGKQEGPHFYNLAAKRAFVKAAWACFRPSAPGAAATKTTA